MACEGSNRVTAIILVSKNYEHRGKPIAAMGRI